jgi:hypothetical protein
MRGAGCEGRDARCEGHQLLGAFAFGKVGVRLTARDRQGKGGSRSLRDDN